MDSPESDHTTLIVPEYERPRPQTLFDVFRGYVGAFGDLVDSDRPSVGGDLLVYVKRDPLLILIEGGRCCGELVGPLVDLGLGRHAVSFVMVAARQPTASSTVEGQVVMSPDADR
jgi:hypothetical protein